MCALGGRAGIATVGLVGVIHSLPTAREEYGPNSRRKARGGVLNVVGRGLDRGFSCRMCWRVLGDAVGVYIAANKRSDQLGEETDAHQLAAQEQRTYGVDDRGALVQRSPVLERRDRVPQPKDGKIAEDNKTDREKDQANCPKQVLRPLAEAGKELDCEQIEEAL